MAKKIANGEFDTELPQIHSQDELKSTTANKERIESELRIAHAIQMGMIPKSFPAFPDRDAEFLAIAPRSVLMLRHRFRQKIGMNTEYSLENFIEDLLV